MKGLEAVLGAAKAAGWPLAFTAYALATACHETAYTMQPVREAFWLSENWRRTHLRYYPFYGRGYVQLTWKANYERADRELESWRTPERQSRSRHGPRHRREDHGEGNAGRLVLPAIKPGSATRWRGIYRRTARPAWPSSPRRGGSSTAPTRPERSQVKRSSSRQRCRRAAGKCNGLPS